MVEVAQHARGRSPDVAFLDTVVIGHGIPVAHLPFKAQGMKAVMCRVHQERQGNRYISEAVVRTG